MRPLYNIDLQECVHANTWVHCVNVVHKDITVLKYVFGTSYIIILPIYIHQRLSSTPESLVFNVLHGLVVVLFQILCAHM